MASQGLSNIHQEPTEIPVAANSKASGSNASVTITLPATSGYRHVVQWVAWSYSSDPTTGNLQIQRGSGPTTIFNVDITKGGPGAIPLPDLPGNDGEQVLIVLAAGGTGITGRINVYSRRQRVPPDFKTSLAT